MVRAPVNRLLAIVFLAAACARAEEASAPEDLGKLLGPVREQHGVPALGAALVTVDGLSAVGACGTRRAGKDEPATAADLWHLGSCTKSMTATLVARLVEKGTLKWGTTLGETFPELKKEGMDPGWAGVTLELLLCNRGGAGPGLDRDGLWGKLWTQRGTPTDGRKMLFEGVVKHPPDYEPGSKYVYSNTNFAIAGYVAEAVTGTAWEELMRREVFTPLGVSAPGFGAPGKPGEKADQPRGHDAKGAAVEPGPGSDNPAAIGPAGIVHLSLEDWGRYVAAHLRGARGEAVKDADGKPFLGADSWTKLHTAPGDSYAMGWLVGVRPGWAKGEGKEDTGRILTHNGSNTMWFCAAWLAPERGVAVLAVCNAGGDAGAKATDAAATAVILERVKKPK
jgi:CubicO group peptidase (beta-lactamase class C family)